MEAILIFQNWLIILEIDFSKIMVLSGASLKTEAILQIENPQEVPGNKGHKCRSLRQYTQIQRQP